MAISLRRLSMSMAEATLMATRRFLRLSSAEYTIPDALCGWIGRADQGWAEGSGWTGRAVPRGPPAAHPSPSFFILVKNAVGSVCTMVAAAGKVANADRGEG